MGLIFRSQYFRTPAGFDPVPFLLACAKRWYFFVLGLAGMGALAVYAVRTVPPKYIVNASLKVNRQFEFPTYGAENRITGLRLFTGLANIYTYIGEVNSRSMLLEGLYESGYDVQYFRGGRETVKHLPYRVELDHSHPQLVEQNFRIQPLENGQFQITSKASDVFIFDYQALDHDRKNGVQFKLDKTVASGEWIEHPWCRFRVLGGDTAGSKPVQHVRFPNPSAEVARYMQKFRVKTLNKGASIITVAITTDQRHKDIALVNRILDRYATANLKGKRQLANNTLDFLHLRIDTTQAELFRIEQAIQRFQEREGFLQLSQRTEALLRESGRLQREADELHSRLTYLQYVQKLGQERASLDTVFSPSMAGINEPVLIELINQASALQREAAEMRIYAGPQNPGLLRNRRMHATIEAQILATLNALTQRTQNELTQTRNRLNRTRLHTTELPGLEREFVHLTRNRERTLAILKRLRKKESQVASALAAEIPDVEILDYAYVKGNKPVAPITSLAYAILVVIGLFIPMLGIMLLRMLRPTLSGEAQLQELCDAPSLMPHPFIRSKRKRIWDGNPGRLGEAHTAMAEAYLNACGPESTVTWVEPLGKRSGSTTVLTNLTRALVLAGRRPVVLTAYPPSDLTFTGKTVEDWLATGAAEAPGVMHNGTCWLVSHTHLDANLTPDWKELMAHLHTRFTDVLIERKHEASNIPHPVLSVAQFRWAVVRLQHTAEQCLLDLQEGLTHMPMPTALAVNGERLPLVIWKRNTWRKHYPLDRGWLGQKGFKFKQSIKSRKLKRTWS